METLKNHKIQFLVIFLLLVSLPVTLFLIQRQQILKSRASLEIYQAFGVTSADPKASVFCSGNICETDTLNIAISLRDLSALEIKEEVAGGQCLWQGQPIRCTGCGVGSLIEKDSCSGEIRVLADDMRSDECNLPEWCGVAVPEPTPEAITEPTPKPQGEPQPVCEERSYCDDNLGLRVFWNTCSNKPQREEFDPQCVPAEQVALNEQLRQQPQPEPTPESIPQPPETVSQPDVFKPIDTGFRFDFPLFVKDSAINIWNFGSNLGRATLEERNLPELSDNNKEAIGRILGSFLYQMGQEGQSRESQCRFIIEQSFYGVSDLLSTENPCEGVDFSRSEIQADEKAQQAESVALESGSAKEALKMAGVDLDVSDEKLNVGICLVPFFNRACITGDVSVPADSSQALSAVMRKNQAIELAEGLQARGYNIDLETDPNEWDPAVRAYFFQVISRGDINPAKALAELFIGIPATAHENAQAAFEICQQQYGKICLIKGNDYIGVANLSSQDIEKANSLVREKVSPDFQPADGMLVKAMAQVLSSRPDLLDTYLAGNEVAKQKADQQVAALLGISMEQLQAVKATYSMYEQAGEYVRNNTTAGKLLTETQNQVIDEAAVNLAFMVDPAPVVEAVSIVTKTAVRKVAGPVAERLLQRFGQEAEEKILVNAERALAKGEATSVFERDALAKVSEVAAETDGVAVSAATDSKTMIRELVKGGAVENDLVRQIEDLRNSPEVQKAAEDLAATYKSGAKAFDDEVVVILDPEQARFVTPEVPGQGGLVRELADAVDNVGDQIAESLQPHIIKKDASVLDDITEGFERFIPCPALVFNVIPITYAQGEPPCNPINPAARMMEKIGEGVDNLLQKIGLAPRLSEEEKIVRKVMEDNGLSPDTILYRVVDAKYVQEGQIIGNTDSMALIYDPYHQAGTMNASQLGVPSLNVSTLDPSGYAEQGYVKVSIRLGDVLEQGGRVYPDIGGVHMNSFVVTVPEGKVKVIAVEKPTGLISSVQEAESISNLKAFIQQTGGIQGSERFYQPGELSILIDDVVRGGADPSILTRSQGLRDKVTELLIKNTDNFDDLYRVFDQIGTIQSSSGEYTSTKLKDLIEVVKRGEAPIESIPRGGDLNIRTKVEELIELERKQGSIPCPVKFGLVGEVLAQEGGLDPCPKNPFAALWHNAQLTGRQVGDQIGGILGNAEEKKALQALESAARDIREGKQLFTDQSLISSSVTRYQELYKDALAIVENNFSKQELPQVKRDLLSILTEGQLQGVSIFDPADVPGSLRLGNRFDNMLTDRELVAKIYLHDPELAKAFVQERIIGGHGSRSGSLVGVLENGLLPQTEIVSSGGMIVTGERFMGTSGERYVSFARWSEDGLLLKYANLGTENVTEEGLTAQLKKVRELIEKNQDPSFAGYITDERFRNQYLDALQRSSQSLEDAIKFLQKPQKTPVEEVRASLITENFPVIYYIDDQVKDRAIHTDWVTGPGGSLKGEFLIDGGVDPNNIKIILVPTDKVEEVEQIVRSYGRDWQVKAIEILENSSGPLPKPYQKSLFQKAGDTVSGWVENLKKLLRSEEGRVANVSQPNEVEAFLTQHEALVTKLKEADSVAKLVYADPPRAREMVERTLRTSAQNAGAPLSEPALFDITSQIIDSYSLSARVKDYTTRYKPEDLIPLSESAGVKPISFSSELVKRVEDVSRVVSVPKSGTVRDLPDIIGALNVKLADASTTYGRDQRRLINILYATPNYPDSYFTRQVDQFLSGGGKTSDLPSLLADLLAENRARYEGFKDYWGPLIDDFNKGVLPVAQARYRSYGFELAPIDPEDITWISKRELEAKGGCEQAFCSIGTPIKDPRNQYFGVVLDPQSASEVRNQSFGSLLHESIHSQILHQIGIHGAFPDKAMTKVNEELTERLNLSIIQDVAKARPELFGFYYFAAYEQGRAVGNAILKGLSISEDEIMRFAIKQDSVGYIKFLDSRLAKLDEGSYKIFIDGLYQDLKIGPAQRERLLTRRVNSIMDIRELSLEWTNNLGPGGQLGWSKLEAFQFAHKNGISLGPDEIYQDVDTFSSYVEASKKLTDNPEYLPPSYYSETTVGSKALTYQRSDTAIPGPDIVFEAGPSKNLFQQAWDNVFSFFNAILNIGRRQSLNLEMTVV